MKTDAYIKLLRIQSLLLGVQETLRTIDLYLVDLEHETKSLQEQLAEKVVTNPEGEN